MFKNESKIKGCILGGAIGDAFGAPIEWVYSLEQLKKLYGPNGLQEFTPYISQWDKHEDKGLGVITDDTTMLACTFAGIIEAASLSTEEILNLQHQYYLQWGVAQKRGHSIAAFVDPQLAAPDYLQPFLRRCGYGRGTMAALKTGIRGTLEQPVKYNCIVDGRRTKSPSAAGGAMMRIAPMAFLYDEINIIELASENAVMTHGHDDAINATAMTAALVKNCLIKNDLKNAYYETRKELTRLPGNKPVLHAWQNAEAGVFNDYDEKMDVMENLSGRADNKNPFLALPVFSQVIYCIANAAAITNPTAENFKDIIRLSANHSGDSDSVAALVGNCLGASWGEECLPKDWLNQVQLKNELINLTDAYLQKANGMTPN